MLKHISFNLFLKKSFYFFVKIVFEVDKMCYNWVQTTVLTGFFGYPYNDLVICKDSPDYLRFNLEISCHKTTKL